MTLASERMAFERTFLGVAALLFAASIAITILACRSMSSMEPISMTGGWTMSMAWMRMPGQTWSAAAAAFLGMWLVMMVAMMLPALMPMLGRYRRALGVEAHPRRGRLTSLVGVGYFLVWSAWGLAAYPIGTALADIEMRLPSLARAVPLAAALVALLVGALQFSAWKVRQLACCRAAPSSAGALSADAVSAFRHGLRLGLHCSRCCAGLMSLLLVAGVMDLRVMALVTAAISAERLAPAGERVARVTGALIVAAGLLAVVRAVGLG